MYLTKEEERILNGEEGYVKQKALEIIVKVAEVLGAERLVKVDKVHISGISYKNIGDAGLELIKDLYEAGGRFCVKTTLNPAGMDLEQWDLMKLSKNYVEKQKEIIKYLQKMGAEATLTCAPYEIVKLNYGEQIAWAESNAVLYANSIIGARTNREGGPLTIFEAICGRAPYIGLRIDDNREPTVKVTIKIKDENFRRMLGLIGFCLGEKVIQGVPYVEGLSDLIKSLYDIRLFLAGVGASSSIGLVLIQNISPEAKFKKVNNLERIEIDDSELKDSYEKISCELDKVDAITIGCPHLTKYELFELSKRLTYLSNKVKVMLFSCRQSLQSSPFIFYQLKEKGVYVFRDTCMVVADLKQMGVEYIITDSAKAAYYLTSQGYKVKLSSWEEILRGVK